MFIPLIHSISNNDIVSSIFTSHRGPFMLCHSTKTSSKDGLSKTGDREQTVDPWQWGVEWDLTTNLPVRIQCFLTMSGASRCSFTHGERLKWSQISTVELRSKSTRSNKKSLKTTKLHRGELVWYSWRHQPRDCIVSTICSHTWFMLNYLLKYWSHPKGMYIDCILVLKINKKIKCVQHYLYF